MLYSVQPDEVYNLAAQSHVRVSFDIPEHTGDITGLGAQRNLEAIIESGIGKKVRFYQASSSEMFGKVREVPQTEETRFHPRSSYGCAKAYAHFLTVNYREAYGLSRAVEYYSILNHRGGVRTSSQEGYLSQRR